MVSGSGYLYYNARHSNLFLNRNTGCLTGGQEMMIMKKLYRGTEIITPAIKYINSCRVKQKKIQEDFGGDISPRAGYFTPSPGVV